MRLYSLHFLSKVILKRTPHYVQGQNVYLQEQSMTYLYWQGAGLLTAAFVALGDYQILRSKNMNE